MSALDRVPENQNSLSPLGFRFLVYRLPHVSFTVQNANCPGISIDPIETGTPFVAIPLAGEHISYEDFIVTFLVDEQMKNYLEIHNWMKNLGFPDNYDQYTELSSKSPTSGEGVMSDLSLMILTNADNPSFNIIFKDAYPISLSSLQFVTTAPSIRWLTASVVFKYRSFSIDTV